MITRPAAPRSRAAAALLVLSLIAAFFGVAGTDAADTGSKGTLTSVRLTVDERTPLYYVTLDFTVTGVQCPARLDYSMGNTRFEGEMVCDAGQTPPTTVTVHRPAFGIDVSPLAPRGEYDVRAFIRHKDAPASGSALGSDTRVPAVGGGYLVQAPPPPVWIGVGDGYTSARNQSSTACWNEDMVTASPTPAACVADANRGELHTVRRNDTDASWVEQAVIRFNTGDNRFKLLGMSIPNDWVVRTHYIDPATNVYETTVVAEDDARSSDLLAGGREDAVGGQLQKLDRLLRAHQGSWNWVGLSTGLLDAGIQDAIWARYGTAAPDPSSRAVGVPQGTYDLFDIAASSANLCPDLSGVAANVTASSAAIRGAIAKVHQVAQAASPGTRTIVVKYPYLTENTADRILPGGNKCAVDANGNGVADNREGVVALNGVIQQGIDALKPVAGSGQLPLVYGIDLATTFTNQPTGTTSARTNSYLQLTRPWGYPYPNDGGRGAIGDAAVVAAKSSGQQLPLARARVVDGAGQTAVPYTNPSGQRWFNRTGLSVEFAVDRPGTGATWVSEICWPARGSVAAGCVTNADTTRTVLTAPLIEARDVPYAAVIIDEAGRRAPITLTVSLDHTAPSLTPSLPPDDDGLYNISQTPLPLTWSYVDVPGQTGLGSDMSRARPASLKVVVTNPDGSATTSTNPTVTFGSSGSYTVDAEICDEAGNCRTKDQTFRIDAIAPTAALSAQAFSGATASPVGLGQWVRADRVRVTNVWIDEGGSGLAPSTGSTGARTTNEVDPTSWSPLLGAWTSGTSWTSTDVTAEGRTFVRGPNRSDVAGNVGVASWFPVRIDRTAPTFDLLKKDGTPLENGDEIPASDIPAPTCGNAEDMAGSELGSGVASCTASRVSSGPAPGGAGAIYVYRGEAVDTVGNRSVVERSFLVTGFVPIEDGRMTVGSTIGAGWSSSGTLRCFGSPNNLSVTFGSDVFNLDRVDGITCFDDFTSNQEMPHARFNTLMGTGAGRLRSGDRATISFTFVDAGEPGVNDAATIEIRNDRTGAVHAIGPVRIAGGNYQAHLAQGNGTNCNGDLNNPGGNRAACS